MEKIINVALQILPKSNTKHAYDIIDKAIEVIHQSGLNYKVCPFETVIEGNYTDVMNVIYKAQQICFSEGASEIITFIKMQINKDEDVFIDTKLEKYQNNKP